jgi:hypothetical protein
MIADADWPHSISDAVRAPLIRWNDDRLGVSYAYGNDDPEMHPLGPEDWPVIRRFK